MGSSSKGGSSKGGGGGGGAVAAPTVSAPPISQVPAQQQTALEQQFVDSPWSVPGWQSSNINPIAQGIQSQYLEQGSTASESSEGSNADLAQWLFGGSTEGA